MTETEIITAEQAIEIVKKERLERAAKCRVRVQKVLEKDNCRISLMTIIRDGNIEQIVDFVAI